MYRPCRNPGNRCPFRDAMSFSSKNQYVIVAFVSRLLSDCFPATVFYVVSTIVIASTKSATARLFSHVCQKDAEIFPAFADRNAPCSVLIKAFVARIRATSQHCVPGGKRWAFCFRFAVSMLEVKCWPQLISKTAARLACAGSKVCRRHNPDRSTITSTRPIRSATPWCSFSDRDDHPARKTPARKVDSSWVHFSSFDLRKAGAVLSKYISYLHETPLSSTYRRAFSTTGGLS